MVFVYKYVFMRLLFISILVLIPNWVFSQSNSDSVEITINVGDSVEIGNCVGDHYINLDYFRKTRWTGAYKSYDTATGDGFYASFFATGDFDMYELPAKFKKRTFVVLGLEVLTNKKTGNPMHVVYLRGPDPNSIIWVDFYEAVDSAEIKFIQYRF